MVPVANENHVDINDCQTCGQPFAGRGPECAVCIALRLPRHKICGPYSRWPRKANG